MQAADQFACAVSGLARAIIKNSLNAYYEAGVHGRVGAGTPNLEGLAIAPTTPTALARHGLQASCRRLRLPGALSQRAQWRG